MAQENVALAPVFVGGFAVQQLLELLTTFLNLDSNTTFEKYKKAILGAVSLIVGLLLAIAVPELRVLRPFGVNTPVDVVVTGLVLSAGTEGVNSVLKFLKYAKEDKKSIAAAKDPTAANAGAGVPTVAALKRINSK